jgi:hypothetical protein
MNPRIKGEDDALGKIQLCFVDNSVYPFYALVAHRVPLYTKTPKCI